MSVMTFFSCLSSFPLSLSSSLRVEGEERRGEEEEKDGSKGEERRRGGGEEGRTRGERREEGRGGEEEEEERRGGREEEERRRRGVNENIYLVAIHINSGGEPHRGDIGWSKLPSKTAGTSRNQNPNIYTPKESSE